LEDLTEAPAWRRRVARAIDLVAALAVFALFLTPVVTVQSYGGPAASTLKTFGWVYLGVLLFLGVVWALKRRRQQHYLTIGLSIMDVRPVRVDETVCLVRTADAPYSEKGMSARAACLVGGLLIVLAAGLLAYEVILYA